MHGSVFAFTETARTIVRLSLLCMFLAFAAYTVAYIVLLVRYRLPAWTGASAFLAGRGQPRFRLLTFFQACAFATPLFFVAFVAGLDASAASEYEAITRIALAAAVVFAALSSVPGAGACAQRGVLQRHGPGGAGLLAGRVPAAVTRPRLCPRAACFRTTQ